MAIRTGLSVTVAGFVIELERDEALKVARVVVKGKGLASAVEQEAIKAAAELLAKRAKRFLGAKWIVKRLSA